MAKDSNAKPASVTPPATAQPEPEYDAAEIAQNAQHLFGYHPDLATAALKIANIKTCTLAKAKSIIKDFAERKVE